MNLSNAALGKIVAIATAATITAVVVAGCISVTVSNQGRVIMGVQANGTTIAGLTKNEARKFFTDTAAKKLQRKAAVLTYKERNFQIDPADINLHGNVDKAVETAYSIGRDGSPIELRGLEDRSYTVTEYAADEVRSYGLDGRNPYITPAFKGAYLIEVK